MNSGSRAAALVDSRQVGLGRDKDKNGSEGRPTIAACACGSQDRMKNFNRIMLRFRPIAPKPTFGGPSYGGLVVVEDRAIIVSEEGRNRNYIRVRSGRRNSNWFNGDEGRTSGASAEKQPSSGGFWHCKCNERVRKREKQDHEEEENPRIMLNLRSEARGRNGKVGRVKAVEAVATVGYVRETCMYGGEGLGSTNAERMSDLEEDTCPGFVSDVLNRVQWMNGAFRKMVSRVEWQNGEEQGREHKVEVRLQMKEGVPYEAFTCQMKVQYRLGKEIKKPEIVPCDAWRMNDGGFAWRLDVKSALRLGL